MQPSTPSAALLLSLALAACDPLDTDDTGDTAATGGDPAVDDDGDGISEDEGDCDDTRADVSPDQQERLNDGLDNDCDGVTDPLAVAFQVHADGGHSELGGSLAAVGDVDGDGSTDLLFGAEGFDFDGTDVGGAFLFTDLSGGVKSSAEATAGLLGQQPLDRAGTAVAGPGDLDGDGYDDLLIGALGDDRAASNAGAAWVVAGPVTGVARLRERGVALLGRAANDNAGSDVAAAGDLDGDGAADLLVAARYADSGGSKSGEVYVVFGPVTARRSLDKADAVWRGAEAGDVAGHAARGAGDADGDGLSDLLIGAPQYGTSDDDPGMALLLYGPAEPGGSLEDADAALIGVDPWGCAGVAVARLADTDGDGYDDLLVGAYKVDGVGTDAGAAYLALGPQRGASSLSDAALTVEGAAEYSYLGSDLDLADVDGDGRADLLLGAVGAGGVTDDRGGLFVLLAGPSGVVTADQAEAALMGEAPQDMLGRAVAAAGDVDGDGLEDALVGAVGHDHGGSSAGLATLLLGHRW